MTLRRLLSLLPFAVCAFLALVWLNQGDSKARNDAVRVAHDTDPVAHPLPQVRHTLMDLYERAWDEEIYFAMASAMRGLPYDHERLSNRGDGTPPSFRRAPPEDGHWHAPYAEVPLEYPAAMLPFVLLPSFLAGTSFTVFTRVFGALMGALLLAAAALGIRAQPERGTGERWWAMALMLAAQGSLAIQRLDAVLALLLAWTLWAAAERRQGQVGTALGLATATKLLPVLLAPLVWAADRFAWGSAASRRRGAIGFAVAMAIGFAPMLLAPRAVLDVLRYHGMRGLQVESSYAVLLGAWELVTGTAVPSTLSYGSWNLAGPAATFFARVSTPITLAVLALLTVRLARSPEPEHEVARRDRLALALLAGVTTLWLTAKVFSPQYLTWAMPLVLAVSGTRGIKLTWLLAVVMLLTQIYMRSYYDQVIHLTPLAVGTLLVRLALLGLFATLILKRDHASRVSSVAAANRAVASSK